MRMFYSIYFTVPTKINSTGEVYFRKECPLFSSFPPLGLTVKVSDPDGELRWYRVSGMDTEETGKTWSDNIIVNLIEDDVQEEHLDAIFSSSDEETVKKVHLHIEHLKANGWEQQPDLP